MAGIVAPQARVAVAGGGAAPQQEPSNPPALTVKETVENTLADPTVRSKRAEFGLDISDSTVETAVRETVARGATGPTPLGIALTDTELDAAKTWIRWVQELDEYSNLAAAHHDVTAGYESNHDIDDPQFYVQVTAKATPELVDQIAKTVPADLPYEMRHVEYSSAQVFAAALAVESEMNGGPPIGLVSALDSIGLGAPTQVMVSPSSQVVRVGVDRSSDELLSLDVQRKVTGVLPIVEGVPLEIVSYQDETAPQGRLDSPGQPKAGLRVIASGDSCTSAGSIVSASLGLFNMTAGHCYYAQGGTPVGGGLSHQGVSWGTVSDSMVKNVQGSLTVRALDYAFAAQPNGGMVSEYVMEVSDTTGASSFRTITGTNAASETTSMIACYGGASSNRSLVYASIPYRTLCGWIVDALTSTGRVQVSVNVCLGDSGALVYLNSAALGIVSRSNTPIAGTGTPPKCHSRMEYARMLNQFADIGGAQMVGQSWGLLRFNHSSQCLDASYGGTASPTTTTQYPCHAGVPQRWRLVPVNNGSDSDVYYVIRNDGPYCLDAAATWDGAPVYQYGCHYNVNQQWRIVRVTGDLFTLRPLSSPSKCVEISGGSLSPGVATTQVSCNGANWQSVHL